MLFRRSKPEMVAVRPSAPPLDELDSALDTIAQILRSIGKNAIGSEERSSQAVRAEYDGWAQKLLIGNREDEAGGARDYRGVRRFVGQERSEEHSYVTRTLSSLREAVSEFGRAVTTGVSADRREDGEVRTALGGLMDALGGSDPDRIAREATAVAGVVQRALDSRARRQEQQIDRLRSHVRVLQEQLEAARHQATKDKVTGLFNSAAFMDHLERVTELSLLMDREPILVLVHVDAFDRLFDEHGQERDAHALGRARTSLLAAGRSVGAAGGRALRGVGSGLPTQRHGGPRRGGAQGSGRQRHRAGIRDGVCDGVGVAGDSWAWRNAGRVAGAGGQRALRTAPRGRKRPGQGLTGACRPPRRTNQPP